MHITGQTVVVTGANRGLGRSLVEALLDRGASKVYAAARNPASVLDDPRVVAVALDLLDRETIAAAARHAGDATVLINNASTAAFAGSPRRRPRARCATRCRSTTTGPSTSSAPSYRSSSATAVARSSTSSHYSRSPARRRWPATRRPRQRPTRSPRRCDPCSRPRASASTASTPQASTPTCWPGSTRPRRRRGRSPEGVLDGLAADEEDIFPDPNAQAMAATWRSDPKAFERAFSGA